MVPPGWTRVDESSPPNVQSLLRVGARVATYYEPDRVWCPGFVVPHVGPRGVVLALAYDDVRGTRVGDGEEPFTGAGDFEHHLLVRSDEETQTPEFLQYCTEVEFKRLQRIFLGDDTAMVLPTADALYSPSLQVHSSGQGLMLFEEPAKENGFAVLGVATGVRAKRLFAPTNSLCMTASDVLRGSLTDLWTLAARPPPSAVSSAAANSYFAPVEVSLQDTSTLLWSQRSSWPCSRPPPLQGRSSCCAASYKRLPPTPTGTSSFTCGASGITRCRQHSRSCSRMARVLRAPLYVMVATRHLSVSPTGGCRLAGSRSTRLESLRGLCSSSTVRVAPSRSSQSSCCRMARSTFPC